ncbi:Calx-beta domain-containing protein [Marinicella meishanensis]|uniref:Calx-beta domain-containing protein n=1 Tax=Marinicella meishanensis TaxID=2873263 RepID=UPI001CBD31EB|nr:Calx-beta domain-containing protein [Marinicella sp. NBU2979]
MKAGLLWCNLLLMWVADQAWSQCGELDTQWENIGPTPINYGFGGGWISGVPDPVNSVLPTDPKGVYERYFSPNPGVTGVDAVRVGLGGLTDANDDMTFQVMVYDDDGFGAPGAFLGGTSSISPTVLGVPQNDPTTNEFAEFWIDLPTNPIPTTGAFHVGVEIFPGGADDVLVVTTSCLGPPGCPVAEGEADESNHIFTTGFGYENLLTVYGADFDINIVPRLIEPANIGGLVWLDRNGNGVNDPAPPANETPIDDLVVYLDENGNNIKDPGEPESTTAQGLYAFNCLAGGNYAVALDAPTIPSGVLLTTGMNPTLVSLASNQTIDDLNFGFSPILDLSIDDVTLLEGDAGTTAFDFTVNLSFPGLDPIDVSYATADGSALAGTDYFAVSDALTFAPGEQQKTITVDVLGDQLYEGDETFQVQLSNPVNANIADGSATGTILDDDDVIFANGFGGD